MAKLLPKETETKASGSDDTTTTTTIIDITNDDAAEVSTVVNSSDNLMEEQQQQQQLSVVPAEDSPKFDQYLLDTITAAVTQSSSSTSITSSMGYAPYNNFCGGNSQNTNSNGGEEMPQLLNILNELLDGQDITSLANSGGNGGIIDQEENYEDDSPRKDDPDEIARIVAQQRLEEISREEQQIQRRMDFLIRRLYKLVARSTGVHVSEEIAGFLEHVARFTKKKEKERQLSLSVASKFPFLTANLQGTSAELLKPPSVTEELPLNILSSPSTSTSTSAGATTLLTQEHQQQQQQQPLSPQTDNNNTINVIEPNPIKKDEVVEEPPKPVPIHEMKSFLRRIENISNMQSTALNKRGLAFKFFTKASSNNLNQMSSLASKRYQHHQHESGSGSSSNNNFKVCAIPKLADGDVDEVEQTSGLLMTEMRLIQNQLDSDATASSTGGESADEMIPYNNQYQQPLSISKRAAFKYAKDRGAVASRWCWLATQISELDYKIRQLTDMKKHVRETKSAVTLEATGFEGQLPGNNPSRLYNVDSDSEIEGDGMTSARTRAYIGASFKKRKLVQILNLHHASKKATRPSTIKCGCNWPIQPCVLCIGRTDPTQPRECIDILPESERVALLDPAFHPVLSFPEDVPTSIHVEAICNIPEWQSKMIRSTPKSIMKHATKQLEALEGNNGRFREENKPFGIARSFAVEDVVGIGGGNGKKMKKGNIDLLTGKRKYTKRLLKGIDPTLANKIKERKKHRKRNVSLGMGPHPTRKYTFKKRIPKPEDLYPNNFSSSSKINGLNGTDKHFDLHHRSKNSSPVPNNKTEKSSSHSRRTQNYDIDNIVIPYSIAAATKIEILSYKEIPTPKWRIISDEEQDQLCMLEEDQYAGTDETLEEDITDECMALIHDRAMMDERKKFETYLKFPLTSRSRANRRIDSRGNESSGANTPTPDATSPAPLHGDIESIPSPLLDNSTSFHENPSITALLNNINGRKERKRTLSKKDEIHDGGGSKSGSASRCISPDIKEIIPAYEPLSFPLTEVSLTRMKREMPVSRPRKSNTNAVTPKLIVAANNSTSNMSSSSTASAVTPDGKFSFISLDSNTSQHPKQITVKRSVNLSGVARPASLKKRKHNDSISESILIKEKLPTASLSSSKNNNVLIPRNKNNHNILKTIDLKKADTAALKKLMNNNNGDLINNGAKVIDFENDEDDDNDNNEVGDSDSETVTGDESPFEQDDDYVEEEEEEDSSPSETEEEEEEYLEEYDEKLYNKKKNNSSSNKFVDCHY